MTITSLTVVYRDGTMTDGAIPGPTGAPGLTGPQGPQGLVGAAGTPGRSVDAVTVNGSSHLIVTYSDGLVEDAGVISAPPSTTADDGTF